MTFWLVMQSSAVSQRPLEIRKSRTVIGRAALSDVRIAVPGVELKHCEIVLNRGELRLADLGSPDGVLHNGQRVREAVLSDSDRLTIGPVTFEIQVGDAARLDGQAARRAATVTEVKLDPPRGASPNGPAAS